MALRTRYFLEKNEGDRRIFWNVQATLSSQPQHYSGPINALTAPANTEQRLKLLTDPGASWQWACADARPLP